MPLSATVDRMVTPAFAIHMTPIPDREPDLRNYRLSPVVIRRVRAWAMDEREFFLGQRVRLSALGRERSPRTKSTTGIVVGIGGKSNPTAVEVRLDGNKTPWRYHPSYLEPDE